jgi:2'-hydroxyisoflavone reductase
VQVLVLGGTRFVGRALVDDALARGWDVTAVHRGRTGALPDAVHAVFADRESEAQLATAFGDGRWDLVVDTWAGAPAVAAYSADLLRGRVDRYGYVSSASVYEWGRHVDENSPTVAGSWGAADDDRAAQYAANKRGAEIAVLAAFGDAVLARAGLILGPNEDIGRLPWWLERIDRGGRVLAPGRPERPLQYVDARDLATWMWSALADGISGPVDVISPSGHATTSTLLSACIAATGSDAELVWIDEARLAAAGVEPWTQLPCWAPEAGEFAGFLEADTSRAAQTGLRCRPVEQTVADTWAWLQREGKPPPRPDREPAGLPADLEQRVLAGDPA